MMKCTKSKNCQIHISILSSLIVQMPEGMESENGSQLEHPGYKDVPELAWLNSPKRQFSYSRVKQ